MFWIIRHQNFFRNERTAGAHFVSRSEKFRHAMFFFYFGFWKYFCIYKKLFSQKIGSKRSFCTNTSGLCCINYKHSRYFIPLHIISCRGLIFIRSRIDVSMLFLMERVIQLCICYIFPYQKDSCNNKLDYMRGNINPTYTYP